MSQDLTQIQIDDLEKDIVSKGVILTNPITQDSRVLIISFQKSMAPLLAIIESASTVGGVIIGWQLLKDEKFGLPLWGWALIGGALIYGLSRQTKRSY